MEPVDHGNGQLHSHQIVQSKHCARCRFVRLDFLPFLPSLEKTAQFERKLRR